ncbi:MAG: hypothetical protein J6Y19_06215, partial [Kiritimatiellae bacterium]|nr:hypothetical protein [Kiritimatiellia bacterium]
TATTNIAVLVGSPAGDEPIEIDSVVSFDLATGKAHVKLNGKDVGTLTSVPYWTTDAAGLLSGKWTLHENAPVVDGDVEVNLDVPDEGALFLTFSRPPQKD